MIRITTLQRAGLTLAALALCATMPASIAAQDKTAARHIPAAEAAAILEKALSSKQPQLASASNFNLMVVRRAEPAMSEFHQKRAHVFFVFDGEATLVTGGTIQGSKELSPGELRGTGVANGATMQLHKGDVVVVPAATPHWFADVRPQITYYSVNIDQP